MIASTRPPRRCEGIASGEHGSSREFSVDALAVRALNSVMNLKLFSGGALAAWLILLPAILPAATHYVDVDGQGFFPSTLTITQGDEVIWVNADEDDFPHTTTSTLPILAPDYWSGSLFSQSDSFAKTFSNVGTFNYFDQADIGTGSITVVAPAATSITLGAARIEGGLMLFAGSGLTPGNLHVLQASTNLTTWTSISTNLSMDATVTFTNSLTGTGRFFRVYEIQ